MSSSGCFSFGITQAHASRARIHPKGPRLSHCGARCSAGKDRNSVLYTDSTVEIPQEQKCVGDVMTTGVHTVSPTTGVLEALQVVVDKRITGLPVVDKANRVIGVVSDFDLLAIDRTSLSSPNLFPPLDQSWKAFNDLKNVIDKVEGQIVEDVMTPDPVVVRSETSLDAAATMLLQSKIRRLPVVDKNGELIGVLTRRDIIVAALQDRNKTAKK